MQARYNDPAIGRFLSSDPVGFAQGGPGYSNRYAYVMNDPVNATDPTGMCPRCLAAAGRVGVRTVRYGGNVGRATRETMNEIRHDAGMLVAADSSGAQRAAALFNLASPVSTRDLQAVGNWVFNESAEGSSSQGGTVEGLIEESRSGNRTRGRTRNHERLGGANQANEDFDNIVDPGSVEDRSGGQRIGTTPDSRRVNVRPNSTYGTPTVEVINSDGTRDKFRYPDREEDR